MKKILFISLAVVLALSMGLVGCGEEGGGGEEIPYLNDGWFVQETIGDPETFDPAWAYDNASGEQLDYVYETLINYDGTETAEFVPVLATSVPAYNTTTHSYTFTIRSGVTFHNGNPLTAEDVEYTFERAMVQDRSGGPLWMLYGPLVGGSGWTGNFTEVDQAIEVDGDDVIFTLSGGDYWSLIFLQILCGGWSSIMDKEWCVANGDWDGNEGTAAAYHDPESGSLYAFTHENGTGPWMLNEWDVGNQIVLDIYPDYWGDPAPFDKVITKKVDEWADRKLDLLAGECDMAYVPRQYIDELEGYDDLTSISGLPELQCDAIHMNFDISVNSTWIGTGTADGNGIPTDFFSDVHIRRAFNYAFDFDQYIAEIFQGEAIQPSSPVVEGLYGYDPDAPKYSLNLTKAAEEFQAATIFDVWNTGFKFTLIYNTGNVDRKAACQILADNLLAINPDFQVSLLALDWGTQYVPELVTGNLPCFHIGWGADYPHADNFITPYMATFGTFSAFQGYGSPTLDAKIQAALEDLNPTTQLEKYYELQEIFYEDAPDIMLNQATGRRWFTKYIEGFYFNPMINGDPGPLYYMTKSAS